MATRELAERFMAAMAANDASAYSAVLSEDAGLRYYGAEAGEVHHPRWRVIERLQAEWSAWSDPCLETLTITAAPERAVVEFRLQAPHPESGRLADYNRVVVLTAGGVQVEMIDLYATAAVPSAPRGDWVAPATLRETEIDEVIERARFAFDVRAIRPHEIRARLGLREFEGGNDGAHPASNGLSATRWTEAEADAKIEAILERYRAKQAGFNWWVGPGDTPADLGERLVRHGLALAGAASKMVKVGLDDLDLIPVNRRLEIERFDATDEAALDAALSIMAVGFSWPPEQIARARSNAIAEAHNPLIRKQELNYLARLDGRTVGTGRLILRGGVAYLGGATTLPEFRSQHVYSTLLRRRLEAARERGYQLAVIDAEPMSRRVVVRYGFVERGATKIYGWMPAMDLDVIRSLVPQD
ncbi:MAG: DUF4440 domain-containing protein [Anaerolineales bacterium]|nr:DUF4440 domain-containing protein [Anaerolineales bacterium]